MKMTGDAITDSPIDRSAIKDRLLKYIGHLGLGQNAFEKKCGLAIGFVSKFSGNITMKSLEKIKSTNPDLNEDWLLYDRGEMLRGVQQTNISGDNAGIGSIGQMSGGSVDIHHNGGKDRAIVEQEKNVQYSLDVLTTELQKFHEQADRKDEYIREIVKASFERNEEYVKRVDDLIKLIVAQDQRIQARADRMFDIMEKKL